MMAIHWGGLVGSVIGGAISALLGFYAGMKRGLSAGYRTAVSDLKRELADSEGRRR